MCDSVVVDKKRRHMTGGRHQGRDAMRQKRCLLRPGQMFWKGSVVVSLKNVLSPGSITGLAREANAQRISYLSGFDLVAYPLWIR